MTITEPEWDDFSRREALASVLVDAQRCRGCGQAGGMVEMPDEELETTWPDGQVVVVKQYRCQACGAREAIERQTRKQFEKHEDTPDRVGPMEGRRFVAEIKK